MKSLEMTDFFILKMKIDQKIILFHSLKWNINLRMFLLLNDSLVNQTLIWIWMKYSWITKSKTFKFKKLIYPIIV